ncbi:MAG TPA: hypothetical protein VM782_14935, partial [Stellaceae bacterium]|nr:hypothetical protein [Stellaceae bacterium]
MQFVGDLRRSAKGHVKRNEIAVAMDQHGREIIARASDDLGEASRMIAHRRDVAHRTDNRRPSRARRNDQRIELETERPAGKRKALDDDGISSRGGESREQRRASCGTIGVIDRNTAFIDERKRCITSPDRRQLNDIDTRRAQFRNRRPAMDERHADAGIDQRFGDAQRALQMPNAQQMLHVKEHMPRHHASNGMLARSTAGRPDASRRNMCADD